MIKKNGWFHVLVLLAVVSLLAACGSSSSSTATTIPSSATVFYGHNLVFRNVSTLLTTGYNGFGQLGTGNLGNRSVPDLVSGNLRFSGFAAGGNHSVAFFNNSTVRSWGYNASGQLGNDSLTYSSLPVKAVAISNVTAVTAGGFHSLALKGDDTLWAWGSNELGQLGILANVAPFGYSTAPVRVGASSPFSNISSISAGGKFSLARAGGRVWAWGDNGKGQIGLDPKQTTSMAIPVAVNYPFPGGVTGIAAGGATAYAVAGDGTLWAWGNNENGQLGDGTLKAGFTPVRVMKTEGVPLDSVVQVAAGIQHGIARCSDGTLWAWGYNLFGQLGNNRSNSGKDSPYAVQVWKDASGAFLTGNVESIRAFGSSSMAMIGGVWYVWGDNTYGQLGTGSNGTAYLPVKMSGF